MVGEASEPGLERPPSPLRAEPGAVAAEADQWAEEFVRSAIDSAVSVAECAAPPKPRVHSGAVVFRAASLREDTAWAECYDDEGNVYFANSNTGETSWTRPPELN